MYYPVISYRSHSNCYSQIQSKNSPDVLYSRRDHSTLRIYSNGNSSLQRSLSYHSDQNFISAAQFPYGTKIRPLLSKMAWKVRTCFFRRFQQLSNIYEDIPMFAGSITSNLKCVPCLVSKLKYSPIDNFDREKTSPHSGFHFDLPCPIKPSLGGNVNIVHFIQPTSSISDVRLIKPRSETSNEVKSYIAKFDSTWQHLGCRVSNILHQKRFS